jgi:hypothetical protein
MRGSSLLVEVGLLSIASLCKLNYKPQCTEKESFSGFIERPVVFPPKKPRQMHADRVEGLSHESAPRSPRREHRNGMAQLNKIAFIYLAT